MADPLLVDAMLAHMPPKLVGTYNKGKRYKMQVDVWERWGETVTCLVGQGLVSNMVAFKRR